MGRNKEKLKNLKYEINEAGGVAKEFAFDLNQTENITCLVQKIESQFNDTVDILVNSAGVPPRNAPPDWDFEKRWDFVMEVNLKGSMLMSYESVEQMKKNSGGSIINLSSIIGLVGYSDTLGFSDLDKNGINAYPHSKGGVIQMTRDMGVNLAKHSIRVNALCPGFAYTNLTKSILIS